MPITGHIGPSMDAVDLLKKLIRKPKRPWQQMRRDVLLQNLRDFVTNLLVSVPSSAVDQCNNVLFCHCAHEHVASLDNALP